MISMGNMLCRSTDTVLCRLFKLSETLLMLRLFAASASLQLAMCIAMQTVSGYSGPLSVLVFAYCQLSLWWTSIRFALRFGLTRASERFGIGPA